MEGKADERRGRSQTLRIKNRLWRCGEGEVGVQKVLDKKEPEH